MRTTVNLDQDIVAVARSLAATKRISFGAAVSALARRGIAGSSGRRPENPNRGNRFPTVEVAEEAPAFGTDEVRRAVEDE